MKKFFTLLICLSSLLTAANFSSAQIDPDTLDFGYFKNGTMHLVLGSHQDIAWMDSPEECIKWRDLRWITPSLQMLKENPEFKVTMEDVRMRLEQAKQTGEKLVHEKLRSIASRIKTDPAKGQTLVVFNSLSWERSNPVTLDLPPGYESLTITDHEGNNVPYQRVDDQVLGRSTHKDQVVFVAENIPAVGYKTYYLNPGQEISETEDTKSSQFEYQNDFFRIILANGGIKSLFDKELENECLVTEKFLGGEIFVMQSNGNGAGEFKQVQATTTDYFERMSDSLPEWKLIESVPLTKNSLNFNMGHNAIESFKITPTW